MKDKESENEWRVSHDDDKCDGKCNNAYNSAYNSAVRRHIQRQVQVIVGGIGCEEYHGVKSVGG